MSSSRAGRPREEGERYPGGKLKPKSPKLTFDAVAPAAWGRIRSEVVRISKDPRLATEVGRLSLHRIITDRQAATAFRVGEIYGAFERHKGKSRTTRSPSYEMGFGGGLVEELLSDEQLMDLEDRIKSPEEAFLELQDILENYPRTAVAALEQLCVEDRAINPTYMENMQKLLDNIAGKLSAAKRRKKVRITGSGVRVISEVPKAAVSEASWQDNEKTAVLEFVRALRPDLSNPTEENLDKLREAYEIFVALKDRARFEASKLKTNS